MLCFAGTQQLPSLQLWHRQLHADASTSPAALAAWVQEQGGSVEGVNVQPAGGGAGYGLWSSQVHTAQPAPVNLDRPGQINLHFMQELQPGMCLVHLPRQCQLTYDSHTQPELLELIEEVPSALWGARLALQVMTHCLSRNHLRCYSMHCVQYVMVTMQQQNEITLAIAVLSEAVLTFTPVKLFLLALCFWHQMCVRRCMQISASW